MTGRQAAEYTNATSTQFYDPVAGGWATGLLDDLDVPTHMLPDVVPLISQPLVDYLRGRSSSRDSSRPAQGDGTPGAGEKKQNAATPVA